MKSFLIYYLVLVIVCFVGKLILENTRFYAFANKAFSLVVITCMSMTIIMQFSSINLNLSNLTGFKIDESFINTVNQVKIELIKNDIKRELEYAGIDKINIEFLCEGDMSQMQIIEIHVYVIGQKLDNNLSDRVITAVNKAYGIEKEKVKVYEQKNY